MQAQLAEYYTVETSAAPQDRDFPVILLEKIKRLRSEAFSGVGLVFYYDLEELPSVPLGHRNAMKPDLPIFGAEAISRILAKVSDQASPWHDGFHMIDMRSQSLTHISQFLAPPLKCLAQPPEDLPSGARQMTALLTSLIPGITYVGVLGMGDEIVVYKNGRVLARATEKNE
ncbi:hypothetical protein C1X21_17865 [Pseudomonas sp. FW305-3-2-15-A-LB2]|nr:hypothetical protein C1X17_22435 [Pseudomonas sp. FW305-3-2-15-C-TSA2]PMV27191.1 hypothetical protein C1X22_17635 [Pseudomonas sp. DP16D-L5]PMV37849.1 hypothetical protein C1X21_17865 [Pseudomonas sp. FW305-3-2-15-A-LB2]PMV44984.1 hypothetical protein C1X16_15755 [Pseudomonas sp. FW305-3-2-15-C-R2A1]PMV50645.1 hypothetical protein C1X18_16285 [Pseudomonas sp. FW305-3-2-15-C-LB1]PMV55803.1 hypothetical protein C1X19_16625 [Pseudomonas sp. GW460-4]PMV62044.1 hypothetical protein C1X20_16965 